MLPLVSAITPTWQRHDLLLSRCIPSVQAQVYPQIEHVIVSDGPDPELRELNWWRDGLSGCRYYELPEHDPAVWGLRARLRAIGLARGELIAYLDDDDAWRPWHITALAAALAANPSAGFAYSRAHVHLGEKSFRMGDGAPAWGRVATGMIMHRRELLDVATWRVAPGRTAEPGLHPAEDWDLVERWLDAGTGFTSVDEVTLDYYPAQVVTGTPASAIPWSKTSS